MEFQAQRKYQHQNVQKNISRNACRQEKNDLLLCCNNCPVRDFLFTLYILRGFIHQTSFFHISLLRVSYSYNSNALTGIFPNKINPHEHL